MTAEDERLADVIRTCEREGVDLAATTSSAAYDALVDEPFRLGLGEDRLVLVLGNTAALWSHVDRFARSAAGPLTDPVDTYVERVVARALEPLTDLVIDVRFAHEPPPRRIAIQRLADLAGLAWLSPSHLCVHRVFGPWIALRAAVVLDVPAPPPVGSIPPCSCADHCLPWLDRALADGVPAEGTALGGHHERWLAVRDACPVGRAHRYRDEQICYHYTGERPSHWPALG